MCVNDVFRILYCRLVGRGRGSTQLLYYYSYNKLYVYVHCTYSCMLIVRLGGCHSRMCCFRHTNVQLGKFAFSSANAVLALI